MTDTTVEKAFEPVYVFVYGTLKGMHRGRDTDTIEFIGRGKTEDKFVLYDGGYPAARLPVDQDGVNALFAGHVVGEVNLVKSPELLESLDRYEGHPTLFERKETKVIVNGKEYTAWIYHGPINTVNHRKPIQPTTEENEVVWHYRYEMTDEELGA